MIPDADVAIIGAGPAGSVAAITLAQAGRRVALFDRAQFPREKVCGDALAYSAMNALGALGLADALKHQQVFATDRMRLHFSDGSDTTVQVRAGEAFVRLVPRLTLDQVLVDRARCHDNVRFFEGTRVSATRKHETGEIELGLEGRPGGITRAPVVIVAAGAACQLLAGGQSAQEPRVLALRAYFDHVSDLSDAVELITHERVLPGYFWVFPTGPDSANIGVATYAPCPLLREALWWFLREHPRGRRLGSPRLRATPKGGVIPVLSSTASRVSDGVIWCGDAGRFSDPLTFHGMGPAIWSGALAARVAASAVGSGRCDATALREYDGLWKARFGVNAFFLGMSLFEGGHPLAALDATTAKSEAPIRLRKDAALRYESLLRYFSTIS